MSKCTKIGVAAWLMATTLLFATGCTFDLFHDTSWLTACDIDPDTPNCGDASTDGDSDAGSDVSSDVAVDAGAE